jgi:hypothetical protein
MPIFSYLVSKGLRYTKDKKKYLLRMVITAGITQLVLYIFKGRCSINYLVSLSLAILIIMLKEKTNGIVYALSFLIVFFEIDYGFYGLILTLAFYEIYRENDRTPFIIFFAAANIICYGLTIQSFSMFSLFFITSKKLNIREKINKYFFYAFYPVHLLLILSIKTLM